MGGLPFCFLSKICVGFVDIFMALDLNIGGYSSLSSVSPEGYVS